ncbi:Uncharacterized protein PECH_002380 [Penicillium ucsense]|uniref:Uncharacterized protein n=1 Tax=Penicillium ucsense TaxID=2839758 RepID=A0A8J8W795_9EURO|nr:Uncharacterized protein PECM_003010 [Penicillium ucsense]KAF7737918.1 Uncharacterized protein PECH_002380 [Penicillium ucsense]
MMDLSKDPDYFKYGPTDEYKPVLFPMDLSLWPSSTKSSSTSETGLWKSLQVLSSSWPLSSMSSSSETKRLNGLHVLPPEVFWNMLDECLFQSGNITLQHEPFHLLLALSQVDYQINERVQPYVTRRLPRHFLRRELGDIEVFPWAEGGNGQQWYPGEASDFPIEVVEDFLGRVIRSDCPACFAYILNYCGVDVSHCNHIGWSFIALAIAFGSANIIRYILSHPSASHPLTAQLFGPANINFPSPTPLGILARCRNVDRLDEVSNLIERPMAKANVPSSVIVAAFNADDLYWLCTYIAPHQARRLKKLGFCFSRVTDRMAQWYIWHGAVKNSVEFLDYLRVTCPLDPTQSTPEQTHTPLRAAIAGDRVDVVHWFAKHDLS